MAEPHLESTSRALFTVWGITCLPLLSPIEGDGTRESCKLVKRLVHQPVIPNTKGVGPRVCLLDLIAIDVNASGGPRAANNQRNPPASARRPPRQRCRIHTSSRPSPPPETKSILQSSRRPSRRHTRGETPPAHRPVRREATRPENRPSSRVDSISEIQMNSARRTDERRSHGRQKTEFSSRCKCTAVDHGMPIQAKQDLPLINNRLPPFRFSPHLFSLLPKNTNRL